MLLRCLLLGATLAAAMSTVPIHAADKGEFRPKPETYICPNSSTLGIDCFLDAVEHLYTMCRQVKSIEILEFGYQESEQGVNGAKSEYCIDKHKGSIARPLQAALREASGSRVALEALKGLHDLWVAALLDLKWKPPESDEEYKGRVSRPYEIFRERAAMVRSALAELPAKPATRPAAPRARGKAGAATVH